MKPRPYRPEYVPPAKDSPRAKAQAVQFLVGARSIEHVTAEWLAGRFNLSAGVAEGMLEREVKRRG